ncbi:hypothetical protein [Hyphomicrobium sp.]|uniref:hypothetical protein n=1 Tax=Hyphomicrobium sp. TaxID=82 RepID=UPI000FA97BEA|nr:hypothetical protein [Hyphomicrobium sp.]RUO97379.1 MAG: hypothetical protein EKK30_16820 [Hyphomicrobium sp.]
MTGTAVLVIRRGALHFSREIYERFFNSLDTVVLLRDGDDLVMLPVLNRAAGGYIIKVSTSAGGRVVTAADFFRDNGIEDSVEITLLAAWDKDRAALIAGQAFGCQLGLQTEM